MRNSNFLVQSKERLKQYIKHVARKNGLHITRIYPEQLDTTPIALQRMRNQGFRPRSVLDVGASDGSWTRSALRIFPAARYLLIEPREDTKVRLATLQNMSNVTICNALVGAIQGKSTFYIQGDQSTVFPRHYETGRNDSPLTDVNTIDNLLDELEFPRPQLIKLDIQGAEILALQGGMNSLRSAEYVTMEVTFVTDRDGWPLAHEAIDFMVKNDYVIYDIYEIARNEQNLMFQCMMTFKKND